MKKSNIWLVCLLMLTSAFVYADGMLGQPIMNSKMNGSLNQT